MKMLKKIVAIIMIVATLAVSAACAEGYVKFTKDAKAYSNPGSGKMQTVIRHGSVAKALDEESGYTLVKLNKNTSVWVKNGCIKADNKAKKSKISYSDGGKDLSTKGKTRKAKGNYRTVLSQGKCNIRKSPCLSGKSVGTFKKGQRMKFTGKISTDSRGIDWYSVTTSNGTKAWVSSVYCKLEK